MQKVVILLLAGMVLASAGVLNGTEYYLDSASGNDAADGLTPQTAWRTIARTQADIQPGDRILLKRGEIWREKLDAPNGEEGRAVYYGAYGEGRKPILLGSVDLTDPDLWLAPEEGSKIWKTQPDRVVSAREMNRFQKPFRLYTEKPAEAVMTQKDFDAQAGYSITAEKSGDSPSRIQVILPSLSVRQGDVVRLKIRVRSSIPFTLLDSIVIQKMGEPWTRYATNSPAKIEVQEEWSEAELFFSLDETDENARLTLFLGEAIPDGAVFDFIPLDADFVTIKSAGLNASAGNPIPDVGNIILTPKGKLPADETLRYEDDTNRIAAFKRWKPEDLTAQNDFWYDKEHQTIWFYSEENPALMFDEIEAACRGSLCLISHYVTLENLAIGFTSSHGVAGNDSIGCVVRNCDIFWIGGGEIGGYANPTRFGNGIEFWATGKNHLVENCRFWEVYDVALSIQGPADTVYENITWRNNLIWNCEQSFEIWLTHPNSEVRNVVFEKNRCYDGGYGWSHVQRPDKNGTHLLSYNMKSKAIDFKIQENIFCRAKNGLTRFSNDRIGEFDINRNIWWQPEEEGVAGVDQPLFKWGLSSSGIEVPFEEYRKMTGNDTDSVFAPPPTIESFDRDNAFEQ